MPGSFSLSILLLLRTILLAAVGICTKASDGITLPCVCTRAALVDANQSTTLWSTQSSCATGFPSTCSWYWFPPRESKNHRMSSGAHSAATEQLEAYTAR